MKFFLDTEFIESGPHKPLQLISIGIVAGSEELYLVSSEFKEEDCSRWVKENVLPNLGTEVRYSLSEIETKLLQFITHEQAMSESKLEFWGYYADYDWVVFCQIFGTMVDLPEFFPMYCHDLKQLCDSIGNPQLPKLESKEHNALTDANWNKLAWEFLNGA
jgi:hypothetical protein